MKITRFNRSYTLPNRPLGISHHGAHLKRKYGGPPWWRYMNGIWIQTRRHTVYVEFFKSFRGGPFYQDRAKPIKEARFT